MTVTSYSTLLRTLTLAMASLWLCCSCIDEYDADLPVSDQQYLVVEGSICGESTCTFYLSKSLSLAPTAEEILGRYINDATVRICGSNHSSLLAKRVGFGAYQANVGPLNQNSSYRLEIEWEGRTYTSEAQYPLATPDIKDLHFEQPREDELVDILITPDTRLIDGDQYFRWDYQENWEIHTPYQTDWDYNVATDEFFKLDQRLNVGWCQDLNHQSIIGNNVDFVDKEIKNLRLYNCSNMDNRFNFLYCTTVTQRAISREEYEYETLRQRQSDDMGGLFTPQPSELPSNISCSDSRYKTIGYVGVTLRTVQKRLYIESKQVGYRLGRIPQIPTGDDLAELGTPPEIYQKGFRVLSYDPMTHATTWIERWGVDCTAWGAKLTPPDFWREGYVPSSSENQ